MKRHTLVHVRFAPKATESLRHGEWTQCAITGCEQSQQGSPYSITSSARASSVGGTSRPSAFAVFRLITNSNFVASNASLGRERGSLLDKTKTLFFCPPPDSVTIQAFIAAASPKKDADGRNMRQRKGEGDSVPSKHARPSTMAK